MASVTMRDPSDSGSQELLDEEEEEFLSSQVDSDAQEDDDDDDAEELPGPEEEEGGAGSSHQPGSARDGYRVLTMQQADTAQVSGRRSPDVRSSAAPGRGPPRRLAQRRVATTARWARAGSKRTTQPSSAGLRRTHTRCPSLLALRSGPQEAALQQVCELLHCSRTEARSILIHFRWDPDRIMSECRC